MNPLLKKVFEKSVLVGLGDCGKPVRCHYRKGRENFLIVTGDNASGKSIFRRAVTRYLQDEGVSVVHLSPEGKSKGGIVGAVIYGSEEGCSTGTNTVKTITKAISTARSRQDVNAIIFDEPDAGLSDEFAAGVGRAIRRFCLEENHRTELVVVISHRRALVRETLPAMPSHLSFGASHSLDEWMSRPIFPRELDELREADRVMFRSISDARTNGHSVASAG